MHLSYAAPILSILLTVAGLPLSAGEASSKKLIEFGWDEPDTSFIRSNITQLLATPFDGCVFHVDYRKAGGAEGSFTWQGWGNQAFTEADVADASADLEAINWGRFKWNFLRFNTTPGKLDWFDDHSAVMVNARLAAQLARAGKCPGILFDIEQYDGPLFNYSKQRDAKEKSWEVYAAQVRKRGSEVMQAFQGGYPGLTVFLTFGYSLPWVESSRGKGPLANCNYGLLTPFLDGMVQAAEGSTRLIDGYEPSYGYKTPEEYKSARKLMRTELLPIVRDPEKYAEVFRLSFGVWLDRDWRKKGWDVSDVAKNYFSPEVFGQSVGAALETADEYVWIYSETPRWWSTKGKPVKLPEVYKEALEKLKQ